MGEPGVGGARGCSGGREVLSISAGRGQGVERRAGPADSVGELSHAARGQRVEAGEVRGLQRPVNSLLLADVSWCRCGVRTAEMFIERRELGDAVGRLTGFVQRGLRLGVLPCSRGGWVVHEQIEGGVDGVFVHAAGALRGLQAWKNHSWSDAPARAAGAEGGLLAPEKNPKCQGGPLQGRDLRGWGCPQCQALAKYCDSDLLDSTPHPALRPRNLGQRFLL